MVHFQELPFDILLHILSFVKPRDIILGTRRTYSAMRDASTNKTLWKNILKHICVENSIFLPSDLFVNMTLPELEQAATGPSRFISHVRNASSQGKFKASSKHYLSTLLLDNPHQASDADILHLYLIPGGRFLISHHTTKLHMWDIGAPGTDWGPTPFRRPLATLNRYCKTAYAAHSTRDGQGLIILSSKRDTVDNECAFSIFEIYPASSSPSFREIASHTAQIHSENYEKYCLTFDKLVILFDRGISVWNFVAGTKVTWALPVIPGDFRRVSIIDDYITLCDATNIYLWTIPTLYPCLSQVANEVQVIKPQYHCGLGKALESDALYDIGSLSDWYHGMNQPYVVDIDLSTDAAVEVTRHLIEFPLLSEDRPPTSPPISVHKCIPILFPEDEGYLEDYRVSDGHIVMYWSASCGLNVQTAPVDVAGGFVDSVSVVYDMPLVERYRSTLCSASGRMCRVLGPDMIEIVDFLESPGRV